MNHFKRKYTISNNELKVKSNIHFVTDLNGITNIFFYLLESRTYQQNICFIQIFKNLTVLLKFQW